MKNAETKIVTPRIPTTNFLFKYFDKIPCPRMEPTTPQINKTILKSIGIFPCVKNKILEIEVSNKTMKEQVAEAIKGSTPNSIKTILRSIAEPKELDKIPAKKKNPETKIKVFKVQTISYGFSFLFGFLLVWYK
jgi:hypothetical protein